MPAGDLAAGTRYAWYTEATDGFTRASDVWTFTTGARVRQADPIVLGDVDSGVADRLVPDADRCLSGLLDADGDWATNAAFVRHVETVTAALVAGGVLDARRRWAARRRAADLCVWPGAPIAAGRTAARVPPWDRGPAAAQDSLRWRADPRRGRPDPVPRADPRADAGDPGRDRSSGDQVPDGR